MSEQHYQRDHVGHDDPHQNSDHDPVHRAPAANPQAAKPVDPLAELARIVSGEEPVAAPQPLVSDHTPPAIPQVAQAAPAVVQLQPAATHAPIAAAIAPVSAPAPAPVEPAQAMPVAPAVQAAPAQPVEDDLESQLLAELGGDFESDYSAEPIEDLLDQELVSTFTPHVDVAVQEAPAQDDFSHIGAPVSTPAITAAEEAPGMEIDISAELEQQLAQVSHQPIPDQSIIVEDFPTSAPVPAAIQMEAQFPSPQATVAPVTPEQLVTPQAIDEPGDFDFGAAFSNELDQIQTTIPAVDPVETAAVAPIVEEFLAEPPVLATPEQFSPELAQTPAQPPQTFDFQHAPDFATPEQLPEPSALEIPIPVAVSETAPVTSEALSAEIDIEDSFSDAFADELSLEMEEPVLVAETPQPVPVQAPSAPTLLTDDLQFGDEMEVALATQFETDIPQVTTNMVEPESAEILLPLETPSLESPQETAIPPLSPPNRSAFRMASMALGAVLVLGAGVVGYNYFSGTPTSVQPTLVKADPSKFKVKPEEPGGKKIANQDQPVYDTLDGNAKSADSQKKLVTANVEPVTVPSSTTATRSLKSSERLSTGEQAAPKNSAIAVMQPRKVKTVTVRADGTIVNSSGAQIAKLSGGSQTAAPKSASIDGAATTGKLAIPSPNPKIGDGAAVRVTPDLVREVVRAPSSENPITNSTRSLVKTVKTTPIIIKPAPKPVVKPTVVASIPAATPVKTSAAVPAKAFVVQISSQRSMEAAEATYQNLKRRFASMLGDQPKEIREAKVEGKGTFYRVRIPIGSKSAAAKFCGRYKSAGGSCFVTR